MIYLGKQDKSDIIEKYITLNGIKKVFVLSPEKFYFECDHEIIEYKDIIEYKYFYRLMQEVDRNTLLVINECQRSHNRNDLTYNCIRNFLTLTDHKIIFQYLPIISELKDIFILVDFDTQSRYRREYGEHIIKKAHFIVDEINIEFTEIKIEVQEKTLKKYIKQKQKMVNEIGVKDPHIIPRNLHLIGHSEKIKKAEDLGGLFVGRKRSDKIKSFSYTDIPDPGNYTIYEFTHRNLDFVTFLTLTKQKRFDVITTNLKADKWYLDKYRNLSNEIKNAYTKIS